MYYVKIPCYIPEDSATSGEKVLTGDGAIDPARMKLDKEKNTD
jgi:hypothetical protein